MTGKEQLLSQFSVVELDREVAARGIGDSAATQSEPDNSEGLHEEESGCAQVRKPFRGDVSLYIRPELRRISNWELAKTLVLNTWDGARGVWFFDGRKDIFQVDDKQIRENAACVAAVCLENNLEGEENGYTRLKLKPYGASVGLSKRERFYKQPVFAGKICTGFLVKEDIVATAAHIADERNVTALRIVFGFTMRNARTPVTMIPTKDIYRGVEIIKRRYIPKSGEPDWALVKLDRPVTSRKPAKPSRKKLYRGQRVYTIGHPRGLPLKAAPGANISNFNKHCFVADLDIYSGNSGSPVFCGDTHKVIGMVVRGDSRDFKKTKQGMVSVVYPDFDILNCGAQNTRISEFIMYCL